MTHAEKEIRNQKIVELRKQGYSMTQLKEMFGLADVSKICKRYGVAGVMSDRKPDPNKLRTSKPDENRAKEVIAKNVFGFVYFGNFTGADGKVDLKCCVCGKVSTHSYISIRKGHNVTCQYCKQHDQEEKRKAIEKQREKRKAESEQRKNQREENRKLLLKAKEHPCEVCGEITTRKKYCSDRCLHKANSATKEIRRRHKIQFAMVDKAITVETVYKRDNGICYLCGSKCQLEDHVIKDGIFIAGNMYPSIDHIIPLSKGGAHSFQNVKLAHRICNSMKADRIIDSPLV